MHDNQQSRHIEKGRIASLVSVAANTVLAIVKVVSGILGNSYALVADGIESTLDVLTSTVVWGGLRISAIPPDDDHPFGHGKAESLAALVVSLALIGAAIGIAIQSVREILSPQGLPAPFTLIVLVAVIVIKEVLFRGLSHIGRNASSLSLEADAWHHRSDALTSAAAFIGISIALFMGEGYEAADDWAALIACGVIAFNGARLLRRSVAEIMDAAPSATIISRVKKTALGVEGVHGVETCRVRKSGMGYWVDLHVEVEATMTVREGHEIAHDVKDALFAERISIIDCNIHVEPS